jgi:hypothetical protein
MPAGKHRALVLAHRGRRELIEVVRSQHAAVGAGDGAGDRAQARRLNADEQISAPQEQVAVLRHRLQETQERVEFAERLLSRGDGAEPLPR